MARHVPFRPLGELFGAESPYAGRPGAWIDSRSRLVSRKWSPLTMAALDVARQAVAESGWSGEELRDAALVVGISRGNVAGWLAPWPGRRPFRLMAASNTLHSEPASAICIELGIAGPNHVLASCCAAGLDAVGVCMMLIEAGLASRALAVAVDLPLVPLLLDQYEATGILSRRFRADPYHPRTDGFVPAEGAAAMAIERSQRGRVRLRYYANNADAADPIGIPPDGGRTPALLRKAVALTGEPSALCTHATGTAVQAQADATIVHRASLRDGMPLHVLKPYLGHTIGASGLLESVVLAQFLRTRQLPPNLPGLHAPAGVSLPDQVSTVAGPVYKLSHGMGGHNSLLVLDCDANLPQPSGADARLAYD